MVHVIASSKNNDRFYKVSIFIIIRYTCSVFLKNQTNSHVIYGDDRRYAEMFP